MPQLIVKTSQIFPIRGFMQQQRSNLVTLGSPQILLNSENKLGLSLLSTIPCYQLTLNAITLKMTSLNDPALLSVFFLGESWRTLILILSVIGCYVVHLKVVFIFASGENMLSWIAVYLTVINHLVTCWATLHITFMDSISLLN